MRYVAALVAVVAGVAGIIALRDATLSTHQPVSPDSRTELIIQVDVRDPEASQTPDEMVEALLLYCRIEVNSDPVGEIVDVGDGEFRAMFQPAMDASNRRQFRGCLEDWTIDQLQVEVVRLADAA